MAKTDRTQRLELYKDRNAQAFLSKFTSGEIGRLEPTYEPEVGYHYPMVETIVGDGEAAEAFLKKLSEAGILEKTLYDKVIYCPKCSSANVSVRYCCPYCKSFNIHKSALIEHVKCGYMDVEENYRRQGGLVCPKCHEELKNIDIDHRKAGIWCNCRECKKSFDIPVTSNFCRHCLSSFTFEDAIIKDVYAYSLKEEAKEEAALGWVLVAPIREFLAEVGFEVESPAFLKGKSGANHMFDIAAYRGGTTKKVTVIDLATSTEDAVSEQPIIALFAKTFDVSPDNAYLVAIPRITDNGKKMAELYSIQIVEAKNQKEAIKALRDRLKK